MKKKIVFAANTSWSIYNFRLNLLRSLVKRGYEVTVVAPRDAASDLLIASGCSFEHIDISGRGANPLKDLKTFLAFFRIYRKLRPGLIFHYTIKAHVYGSRAASILGIKNIAVVTGAGHAFTHASWVAKIARGLYRLGLKGADEVWFLNQDDPQVFLEQKIIDPSKKTLILPSEGIDLDHFKPQQSAGVQNNNGRPFHFLLAARLLWEKGVGEFVTAAREILKNNRDVVFQLLGPVGAEHRTWISAHDIAKWESDKTAIYLGEHKDVRPFIEAADCVVLPSYREGISRILLEAGALKKPVIATDVVGNRSAVIDGVTGYLCEPKSPPSLVAAMEKFMSLTSADRQNMGESGRDFVSKNFDEKRVIEMYTKTLEGYF